MPPLPSLPPPLVQCVISRHPLHHIASVVYYQDTYGSSMVALLVSQGQPDFYRIQVYHCEDEVGGACNACVCAHMYVHFVWGRQCSAQHTHTHTHTIWAEASEGTNHFLASLLQLSPSTCWFGVWTIHDCVYYFVIGALNMQWQECWLELGSTFTFRLMRFIAGLFHPF